jgi:hypothetical protein
MREVKKIDKKPFGKQPSKQGLTNSKSTFLVYFPRLRQTAANSAKR